MFIGQYDHILDKKGRFTIPSKYRIKLEDGFILTKGLDRCLFIYALDQWKLIENKIRELPLINKQARGFTRFFLSGASDCLMDKHGRVLIPLNLREYAYLEKDLTIIGVGTRIEIWSKEEWNNYNNNEVFDFDSIAEKMEELGI